MSQTDLATIRNHIVFLKKKDFPDRNIFNNKKREKQENENINKIKKDYQLISRGCKHLFYIFKIPPHSGGVCEHRIKYRYIYNLKKQVGDYINNAIRFLFTDSKMKKLI